MNLFELKNNNVTFSPQALLLKPFKKIWDDDNTEYKENAIKYLAYIYYMCDDRSDYMYILDEKERAIEVKKILGLKLSWKETKDIKAGMEYYKMISETVSTRLLDSTRKVVDKISTFLNNLDVNERDRYGKPMFDINKIVASVDKIPKLVKSLNEIEKEVIKEKELRAQTGSRDVGMFDDEGI